MSLIKKIKKSVLINSILNRSRVMNKEDIRDVLTYGVEGQKPEIITKVLNMDEDEWKLYKPLYELGVKLGKEGKRWRDILEEIDPFLYESPRLSIINLCTQY